MFDRIIEPLYLLFSGLLETEFRVFISRFFARPHGVGAHANIFMFTPANLLRHVNTARSNPAYFAARLRVMAYQFTHPRSPWLTASATHMIDEYLNSLMTGLEWGSGNSTLWLARRLQTLVSIEHDPFWHAQISGELKRKAINNVDYRLLDPNSPGNPYVSTIQQFPAEHFDFVLIDGECRTQCIETVVPKVKPGGVIVLDNAEKQTFVAALQTFEHHITSNGVWRTDIFNKPS